jgi:signal transduction histidine kinase/CheY-like chemotaxis protein
VTGINVRRFAPQSPLVLLAVALTTLAVFAVDVATPNGVAIWVFYIVPVALAARIDAPAAPLLVAAVTTALTVIGYFVSAGPDVLDLPVIVGNRTFAIVAVWALAFAVRQGVVRRLALQERDWLRDGQTRLAAAVQGEQDAATLGQAILACLCGYLPAAVGVLYAGGPTRLRRIAAHALPIGTAVPEEVDVGEGLLGECARAGRVLWLDDVPPDLLPVTSALGRMVPRSLAVVPLATGGRTQGVLELGMLSRDAGRARTLLDLAAEPLGVALASLAYRTRLTDLLEVTRQQARELEAQSEELRAANDDLHRQTDALGASETRLEEQQSELEQLNAELEEQARAVTEQRDALRRTQGELIARSEELSRVNQYKSAFLASMSHELRTPLNSTLILARLLADDAERRLSAEQVRYAETIHASCTDLLVLINEILDLSRIEAGRLDPQLEAVDLRAVADALRRTFAPIAEERGLDFAVDVDDAAPASIVSDPLRVQQILRNLLANAFAFTDAGSVSLRVGPAGEGGVELAVADTGVGIPADQHDVIFEPFRQGARGADGGGRRDGSGLGLAIVRELTRRLGGALALESTPGIGTTFRVRLPREVPRSTVDGAAEARPPARVPATVSAAATPRHPPAPVVADDRGTLRPGERCVLIVEDDAAFARILVDVAHEEGFRAVVAASADEGTALARAHRPVGVLLDLRLPDHSGLAVLEQLKRQPATRHVPIHVLSVADCAQQVLEMGAVGYVQKPASREAVAGAFARIERWLARGVRRVLLVEDDPGQRESLVALLSADNVDVECVASGAEALARLADGTFDCMVLDLTLPDMSGFALLERLGDGAHVAVPPVVVYTGRALSRDEEERLRRFASAIVIKGARSPERLLDEVTLFLHQVDDALRPAQRELLASLRRRDAVLEGRRVLVAEDDVRSIFALKSALEPTGLVLTVARNGREAVAAADAAAADGGPFDLVLMDVMMPEMDGLAATRELRRRPWGPRVPIIALTAKAMPDDRDRCLEAGADDYVTKPLQVDRLVSLMRVWMPR